MIASQEEARASGNAEIGPEHLVLGLLAEPDGLAARVMAGRGATPEAVRETVGAALPPRVDQVPDLIPYDARGKKALELTFREALRLGHNYIGTEHILLALLEQEDGTGVLTNLGLTKPSVEADLATALAAVVKAASKGGDAQ